MYTINDVATMTGLTTRTLRTYIKMGFLEGEKVEGIWQFSDEQLTAFFANSSVKSAILAKHNGAVFDFMASLKKDRDETCVIMDLAVSECKAREISKLFCEEIRTVQNIRYYYGWEKGNARIILTGDAAAVRTLMAAYHEQYPENQSHTHAKL